MSMTDPIADLLTRIRNAQRAGLEKVELPSSKLKVKLSEVLKNEGFIGSVAVRADGKQGILSLSLKYDEQKNPVISEIRRKSKPGLRVYVKHTNIPKVMNGLGVAVVSTSKGFLVDREARKAHLGGELIATVW